MGKKKNKPKPVEITADVKLSTEVPPIQPTNQIEADFLADLNRTNIKEFADQDWIINWIRKHDLAPTVPIIIRFSGIYMNWWIEMMKQFTDGLNTSKPHS